MAVTVTTILAVTSRFICVIEADADADTTTGNVAHGLGAAPLSKHLCLLQAFVSASDPHWAITTADATNVVAMKDGTAAGSGVANPQVRLELQLPHSLTS